MEKRPLIFCAGANHNSARLDLREALYIKPEELTVMLPSLKSQWGLKELFIISTCNRLEIYGVTVNDCDDNYLFEVYASLQKAKTGQRPEMLRQLSGHMYILRDQQAIEHMFAVTSGVDSLVLGETQITGQFKEALQFASNLKLLGGIFNRLSQDALSVAKKIRTHTEIGRKPVSISHAAIDLANRVYGNIAEHTVLIIGAGEMATVAAKYAMKYKPKSLYVVNRTLSRAEEVVKTLEFGQARSLENLNDILPLADIIISSTSAEQHILDRQQIERIQNVRHHRPLFLIDIALPRDIDPSCASLDDVYLFDIDDLKQVVAEHVEERRLAAEKAKTMIAIRAEECLRWVDSLNLKPALSGFREYLDDLFEREVQRTLSKEHFQNLSEDQMGSLRVMLQSVAQKISSDASLRVMTPPDGFFQEQLASALTALFPKPEKKREN